MTTFPNLLEWLSTADKLTWLQVLLTLSHKYFAHFNRSTCALSVSCHYLGLRGIHLAYSLWNQKQSYSLRIQSGPTKTVLASNAYKCHWTITEHSRSLPNLFHSSIIRDLARTDFCPIHQRILSPNIANIGASRAHTCTNKGTLYLLFGMAIIASSIAFTETRTVIFSSSS